MVGADDEHLEILFSWFDGQSGRPIDEDLDNYIADRDRLAKHRLAKQRLAKHRRSRLWRRSGRHIA